MKTTPLPSGYVVSNDDVICGRGSECFHHVGNQRFRRMIADHLDQYQQAETEIDKNIIISTVLDDILRTIPIGGFIKKDLLTGQYVKLDYFASREKTSSAFRKACSSRLLRGGLSVSSEDTNSSFSPSFHQTLNFSTERILHDLRLPSWSDTSSSGRTSPTTMETAALHDDIISTILGPDVERNSPTFPS